MPCATRFPISTEGASSSSDSVTAGVSRAEFFGEHIQLNLTARETGTLSGEFVVRVDLLPEAARTLAETLTRLADEVEKPGGADRMNQPRYNRGNA